MEHEEVSQNAPFRNVDGARSYCGLLPRRVLDARAR